MLTDTKSPSMRIALQQIYVNLYVEYGTLNVSFANGRLHVCLGTIQMLTLRSYPVVKNPLSPVEHSGGIGVNNELFEESLEQFVVCAI